MSSPAASGTSRRKASTSRLAASQAYAGSVRAHSPTLALPPLSPERAPYTAPRGTARLGPSGTGSVAAATGATATSPAGSGGVGSTASLRPSAATTTWSTTSAGTSAGQYTP